MMTPALGLVLYTPLAFLCLSLVGFSMASVVITWIVFIAAALIWAWKRPLRTQADESLLAPAISNWKALGLIAMAMLWGIIPAINVYPFTRDGGIYTNDPLSDHVKIAFTDAIVREGMPLKNPFYALAAQNGSPPGQRILLSYSYAWYLPNAMVKKLSHASGWQVEVAMTWFTSFVIWTFLAAIACAISGSAAAGFWLIVVAACGPPSWDLLPVIFGPRSNWIFGLPTTHGLEVPWLQLAWAPQHAYSALAVMITLWLVSATLVATRVRIRFMIGIALAAAAAFESSSWVGGVALAAATPVLLLSAALLRIDRKRLLVIAGTVLPAVVLTGLFILPLLRVLMAGTQQSEQGHLIAFDIFPSTLLEDHLGLSGTPKMIARVILFWVHLLPLSFGAIYVIGLPAMIAFRSRSVAEKTFRAVALGGTFGFLLVSQFIKSAIRGNDLGWRAVNVSEMFLCIFAGLAIDQLLRAENPGSFARFSSARGWIPSRRILVPLTFTILSFGLLSTARVEGLPLPPAGESIAPHAQQLAKAFADQAKAWQAVRHFTKPKDLVQANPRAFDDLPPWAISLPYHLFADRSAAYSCDGTARTYAFRYSWEDNREQERLVAAAFAAKPKVAVIKHLRWDLNVMAILVTPADPVWNSTAIEDSGVYKLKTKTDTYKVYVPAMRTLRNRVKHKH